MGAVYESFSIRLHVIPFVGWMVGVALMGCVAFDPAAQSRVENLNDRPLWQSCLLVSI